MGVRFLGFGPDVSVMGNTTQETMIIAQPPESPSVYALPKSYPSHPPLQELMPFLLSIQTYWLMHLKMDSSHKDSVLVFLRLSLGSAPTYRSIDPITSEPALPVCPHSTRKYPPLPRWH